MRVVPVIDLKDGTAVHAVRDVEYLRALGDAGAAGALVATALHRGVIRQDELAELR